MHIHIRDHDTFEQMLCELVSEFGYTADELILITRTPDETLSQEGRWIKTVAVQAALEHIAAHE